MTMQTNIWRSGVLAVGALFLMASAPADDPTLIGFTPATSAQQRALEARLDGSINANNLRDWMQRLSARPHHLGSAYGKANAEFIAGQFKSWGYNTQIEEFSVLFPTPKTRVLELTGPVLFTASLAEPEIDTDATTGQGAEQLPTYNAYSADGDVTAPLVYVNQGIPRDYETLAEHGIDVKGKIVIARYGGSWRGIKPKVAAEHGAVGCIIYSDPRDDGYFQGDVYPTGAWRRESGAQRGSVQDLPLAPGDPLTPGIGATKNARRLTVKESPSIMKIPVLPISYSDALPFLKALSGPVVPPEWRGALPITYHMGPGPAVVHLKLEFNWDMVPLYNVIAKLPGSERPDEWIIRGNHHDAWVNGASDPISGMVALMEEARAVGELAKAGWRPKRTIVYAAWDGEEPGLLGSVEWAETHAELLKHNGAVYINTDSNGRGFLGMSGSHSLESFINQVARDVTDPQTKVSVSDRLRAYLRVAGSSSEAADARNRADLRIDALGSGSDYSSFLQHLGIASLDLGFGGENGGGSYHSIYDSFSHYSRFGDPGFAYGVAMAKVGGRTVLRLASADVLPFTFGPLSETIGTYLKELTDIAENTRKETIRRNELVAAGLYALAADPTQKRVMPTQREPIPFVNFSPLQNSLQRLDDVANRYDAALRKSVTAGNPISSSQAKTLDDILMKAERTMTGNGLPRRPWFIHQVYAPGFYTGYGVKTLPGVREAMEQRNWKEVEEQIGITARALDALTSQIIAATNATGVK
ncbi:MAG: M28 family peptidase [Gemmatimonadaceae bacterium]|nr:M28 family peptidase [Gemmatimonadaceae bacterium]